MAEIIVHTDDRNSSIQSIRRAIEMIKGVVSTTCVINEYKQRDRRPVPVPEHLKSLIGCVKLTDEDMRDERTRYIMER